MKFTNLERASEYKLGCEIADIIQDYGRDMAYIEQHIKQNYRLFKVIEKNKSNPLWRLTILFYFIFIILLVIAMPIKWLITGYQYYDSDSFVSKLQRKWYEKFNF